MGERADTSDEPVDAIQGRDRTIATCIGLTRISVCSDIAPEGARANGGAKVR